MNILKHIYSAIRHGDWRWGWEQYEGKPQFGAYYCWFDGHNASFHCYKLWVGVEY